MNHAQVSDSAPVGASAREMVRWSVQAVNAASPRIALLPPGVAGELDAPFPTSIKTKRIGVQQATTGAAFVDATLKPETPPKVFPDTPSMFTALMAGAFVATAAMGFQLLLTAWRVTVMQAWPTVPARASRLPTR